MNQEIGKDLSNPYWNVEFSLICLMTVAFIITSVFAEFGASGYLENPLMDYLNNHRTQITDFAFIVITTTSDTINLMIAGFAMTIIKRTRKFGMILLISLVAITILVTYLKPLFAIDHPVQNFTPLIALPDKFTLERDSFMPFALDYSFPSNHIASATAFAFIIGGLAFKYSRKFSIGFLIAFPAIIGFTKLYLFQHNVLDLVDGYLLGLIVTSLMVRGLKANTKIETKFSASSEPERKTKN